MSEVKFGKYTTGAALDRARRNTFNSSNDFAMNLLRLEPLKIQFAKPQDEPLLVNTNPDGLDINT